jgi:hypothetical protein
MNTFFTLNRLTVAVLAALVLTARFTFADEKPPATQPTVAFVAGRWTFAERQLTIQVNCTPTNQCEGTIAESPRPTEVGHVALREVHFDPDRKKWRGKLVMPETGSADVDISPSDGNRLQLVAKQFIFTKTLVWVRK